MKFFRRSLIILFLIILLVYVINIDAIPSSVILFQGEKLEVNTILGMSLDNKNEESIETSGSLEETISEDTGKVDLSLKLAGIKLKDVTVNVIPNTVVVPGGSSIGLKLYTNGVMVVGMSEIQGEDKNKYKPYQNSGIEEGDMIIQINEETITCTADLIDRVNASSRK